MAEKESWISHCIEKLEKIDLKKWSIVAAFLGTCSKIFSDVGNLLFQFIFRDSLIQYFQLNPKLTNDIRKKFQKLCIGHHIWDNFCSLTTTAANHFDSVDDIMNYLVTNNYSYFITRNLSICIIFINKDSNNPANINFSKLIAVSGKINRSLQYFVYHSNTFLEASIAVSKPEQSIAFETSWSMILSFLKEYHNHRNDEKNVLEDLHLTIETELVESDHIGFSHRRIFFVGYPHYHLNADIFKFNSDNGRKSFTKIFEDFNYNRHYEVDRRNFNPDGILRTILTLPDNIMEALAKDSINLMNYKIFLQKVSIIYHCTFYFIDKEKRVYASIGHGTRGPFCILMSKGILSPVEHSVLRNYRYDETLLVDPNVSII